MQSLVVGLLLVISILLALYVGALEDVKQRDAVIIEMLDVMSSSQKSEVRQRLNTRSSMLSPNPG